MPNHIVNHVCAPTEKLTPFVGEAKNERSGELYLTFDFQQLIPMPEFISAGSISAKVEIIAKIAMGLIDFNSNLQMPDKPLEDMNGAVAVLQRSNAMRELVEGGMAMTLDDDDFDSLINMMKAYRSCGSLNSYGWCIEHWGTKWNSYDVEVLKSSCPTDSVVTQTTVKFETAWSAPHPVIQALAKKIGGLRHDWADEDMGHNVGWAIYDNKGEIVDHKELSKTKEGMEMAIRLHRAEDRWKWSEEKHEYVYVDDEEAEE